ncbi:hypothetical protein B0H12DRAFT_1119330 [Mycena haematopus]|nr:hypothetical protein B0H12DRAFT_1119330 [Mycena haematopus]
MNVHKLFRGVKYYLPETLPQERRLQLTHAIESNGGERAETMHLATHIITNSHRFQGWQDADEVKIVSDLWVDRTMILGELLPREFYSAEPAKIFSGVVGCGSGISASDLPSLEAGIEGLGGQWRHGLTKDVTHLFATSANSEKYAIAMQYQDTTHVKVLLPHWFDDAIRLGSGKLPTLPYEWPDPKVLHPLPSVEEAKIEKTARSSRKLSVSKHMYYKTALWNPDKGGPFPGPAEPVAKVWDGRKILLSSSLGLEDERRRVVEEVVKVAGGLIIYSDEEEESSRVSDCDVLVTRWRAGKAFFTAIRQSKIVGTLNWLFYVHATGVLSSPMDQLLHYPVRKIPLLHDFTKHQITVTNYTGEAREYLKRLIQIMGATFTPNMSGENTVLIAANMGGEKTQKALAWNIAVVNHVWLEDCFVDWRDITPAVPKYIDFPPNVDFAPMLGERGVKLNLDHLETEEEEDLAARERPPVGTEASVREVEGILKDADVIMDAQDAEEEEQRLAPATSRSKSGSESRMVSASVSPAKHRGPEDDIVVDESPKSTKRGKQRPQRGNIEKAGTSPQRVTQPERSEEAVRKSPERKGKKRQVAEDEEEPQKETTKKMKPNGKKIEKPIKAGSKVSFAPEIESISAGPSNPPASKNTNTTSTTSKRKAQLMESASNDEPDENHSDSPPPKKRAKSNKATSSAPSTSGPAASSSSGKRKMTAGPGRDSVPRKPERAESVRALADERVAKGGSKNSSSAAGSGTKKNARTEVEDDDQEMMPDVVNYGLEGRTQRGRGNAEKKPDDDSADEMPPPKATKGKITKETKNTPKRASKNATSNTSAGSRKSTDTIKIMTTTINLTDTVLKALSKLGAKTASQVSECTHLVAPGIVRTEKLLCALAAGAFIVSEKWAIDSVAAKKLLPEEDYILSDKANEKKWNFRLADAIKRAKQTGGKLFENKSFYVTKGVPVDRKLLKTVVTAQGGKLLTQTPTVRILNSAPNRYVISCAEDISVWRPLTTDHVIYSQELLLTAALTQQIDWDNPAFQISASA